LLSLFVLLLTPIPAFSQKSCDSLFAQANAARAKLKDAQDKGDDRVGTLYQLYIVAKGKFERCLGEGGTLTPSDLTNPPGGSAHDSDNVDQDDTTTEPPMISYSVDIKFTPDPVLLGEKISSEVVVDGVSIDKLKFRWTSKHCRFGNPHQAKTSIVPIDSSIECIVVRCFVESIEDPEVRREMPAQICPAIYKIVSFTGDEVDIYLHGNEENSIYLDEDETLPPNGLPIFGHTVIETGTDSTVTIESGDGHVITVGSLATFSIDKESGKRFKMMIHAGFARIQSQKNEVASKKLKELLKKYPDVTIDREDWNYIKIDRYEEDMREHLEKRDQWHNIAREKYRSKFEAKLRKRGWTEKEIAYLVKTKKCPASKFETKKSKYDFGHYDINQKLPFEQEYLEPAISSSDIEAMWFRPGRWEYERTHPYPKPETFEVQWDLYDGPAYDQYLEHEMHGHVDVPVGTTSPRATSYIVRYEDGEMTVTVAEGIVDVRPWLSTEEVAVHPGTQITTNSTEIVDTRQLSSAELQTYEKDLFHPQSGRPLDGGGEHVVFLEPVADAYVYAYSYRNWNQSNRGVYVGLTSGWHPTGGESRAYIRFDLPAIDPRRVGKATLRLYHSNTGGDNSLSLGVHRVTGTWGEGTGTYQPGEIEGTAAAGEISWVSQPSFDPNPVTQFNPGTGRGKMIEVDITPLVEAWLSGASNNGLVLKASGSLSGSTPQSVYHFCSREFEDPEYHPVLVLE